MKSYSHNYGEYELEKSYPTLFPKIKSSLRELSEEDNPDYQDRIQDIFYSWDKSGSLVQSLNLKYGYRKGELQAEIQIGNVARYYADIMKIETAYRKDEIDLGILILPTKETAKEIGSNIANFEKAEKELVEMREIIQCPIVVYGI